MYMHLDASSAPWTGAGCWLRLVLERGCPALAAAWAFET